MHSVRFKEGTVRLLLMREGAPVAGRGRGGLPGGRQRTPGVHAASHQLLHIAGWQLSTADPQP